MSKISLIPKLFSGIILNSKKNNIEFKIKRETMNKFLVSVKVEYSSLNYKDALALTGKGEVIRYFPMIPGIDFAGKVISDSTNTFNIGDKVILTGNGYGEKYFGGYAEYASVKPEHLVKLPKGMTTKQAMSIGTAGFTAMLCIEALKKNGLEQLKEGNKSILITGASGGVGITALAILSNMGYKVIVSSGREWVYDSLMTFKPSRIVGRTSENSKIKALDSGLWDAVIDTVGGNTTSRILSECKYGASVAICGMAGGSKYEGNILPFILRRVSLLGIESVYYPNSDRRDVWEKIYDHVPWELFNKVTFEKTPKELFNLSEKMLSGSSKDIYGRIVVNCSKFNL